MWTREISLNTGWKRSVRVDSTTSRSLSIAYRAVSLGGKGVGVAASNTAYEVEVLLLLAVGDAATGLSWFRVLLY